jgi:hypothetical protein
MKLSVKGSILIKYPRENKRLLNPNFRWKGYLPYTVSTSRGVLKDVYAISSFMGERTPEFLVRSLRALSSVFPSSFYYNSTYEEV